MFVDGFASGRAATKWAREAGIDNLELVTKTWQQLHARSFFLSKRIMELMLAGELPIISEAQLKFCGQTLNCPEYKNLILQYKHKISQVSPEKSQVQCTWVKKSLPMLFSTKTPNANDLEELAIAYLDKGSYIDNCEKIFLGETKNNPDVVLKFDLKDTANWQQTGFEFWRSFKIYLSLFWAQKWTHPVLQNQEIVRSFAVDEIVTLMADGCYSISRPECDTDFLNVSQLKTTLRKGSFQSSYLMANEIMKGQLSTFDERLRPPEQKSSTNTNTRAELMSLMKIRHQSNFQLYKSIRNLAVIFNQKNANQLLKDLAPSFNEANLKPEVYTLCAEVNKIVRPDLSPFAREISISKFQVSGLNEVSALNQRPEDLFFKGLTYVQSLAPYCERVENILKTKMMSTNSFDIGDPAPSRKWFQTITQYALPIEFQDASGVSSQIPYSSRDAYVRLKEDVVCTTTVDCTRNIMEDMVNVYQVALYKGVSRNQSANETVSQNYLGADVACGLFDPWQQSQLRKKNLVSDLVSSVISGVTMLPIYLDLDFDTKKLVSFSQLYENGKIKFDPQFDQKTMSTTVFLDLGQLAKAPCYVSVSNASKIKPPNMGLLFKGITFQGCIRNADGQMVSNNLELQTNQSKEMAACGACMLNFEEVAITAVTNHYNIFRFGIRFFASLVSHFKDDENPINQPIELKVNPEYVKDAYVKYNSIPDSCMYELMNGAKCMENICLSYTISELENKTGAKVKDGSLWNSNDEGFSHNESYTDAWVKFEGCERETRIPITCQKGKKPTSVGIPKKLPSCARSAK
tara:strand:+ start:4051 stop:6456 length:2406 start_codon:yes stop_codon:yes gene_type:complete